MSDCECIVDPYDSYVEGVLDRRWRLGPRFQVFAGVDGWRIGETDWCGQFIVAVGEFEQLDDVLAMTKLLNKAEALRRI